MNIDWRNRCAWLVIGAAGLALTAGCAKTGQRLGQADAAAYQIIAAGQEAALGRVEPFTIDRPSETFRQKMMVGQELPFSHPASLGSEHLQPPPAWPAIDYPRLRQEEDVPAPWLGGEPLTLSLAEALQVAARNNSDYQTTKEEIFRAALALDLEQQGFRHSLVGFLQGRASTDLGGELGGLETSAGFTLEQRLKSGLAMTGRLGLDLVKLLTLDRASSLGLFADATISLPLLRGSGREVVAEPLTQAEREVVYAIYRFERFKHVFVVDLTREYLSVLRQLDEVANSRENYQILLINAQRAQRLAEAGRLPEIQVDQARQDSLRSRDRWLQASQAYERQLDRFKGRLNLPPDARIELDQGELRRLTGEATAGPAATDPAIVAEQTTSSPLWQEPPPVISIGERLLDEEEAIGLALARRLDLRIDQGRVHDAQRRVVVAADGLRSELNLTGRAAVGERRSLATADRPDAKLRPEEGSYAALLDLNWPATRTAERNVLRNSLINLERTVRDLQQGEDAVKLEIRNGLRDLAGSRERIRIQAQAVEVAQRRVDSTNLLLQAGRVQMRDLLEAQEALVSAQNNLTAARVDFRIAGLALFRDLGVLEVARHLALVNGDQPEQLDQTDQTDFLNSPS
jgi:outer membrane protein TolC